MKMFHALKYLFFMTVLLTSFSCGQYAGNNDYAGGGIGGTGITTGVSVGKITKVSTGGNVSVEVNGVVFTINGAEIIIDGVTATENDLRDGMIIKVNYEFNAGGTEVNVIRIEFEKDIEGPIDSKGTNTLVILGKTILVDSSTKYENITGLDKLSIGNIVEVSGFIDADGNIHATYIELKSETFNQGSSEIELKGTISNIDSTTFDLNGTHVNYSLAQIEPSGASLQNDLFVEVKSTTGLDDNAVLIADKIEIKETKPDYSSGEKVEIEGYITEFSSSLGSIDLKVNNQPVHIDTANILLENGTIISDFKLGIKVEVEGTIDENGVLIAKEISIETEDDEGSDKKMSAVSESKNTTSQINDSTNDNDTNDDQNVTGQDISVDQEDVANVEDNTTEDTEGDGNNDTVDSDNPEDEHQDDEENDTEDNHENEEDK